jgi:magnesium-transporting ATPase (P-type)
LLLLWRQIANGLTIILAIAVVRVLVLPRSLLLVAALVYRGYIPPLTHFFIFFSQVASFVTQQWTEAVVVLIVMISNILIGWVQEMRAQKTMGALQKMAAPVAKVRLEYLLLGKAFRHCGKFVGLTGVCSKNRSSVAALL